ncbi:MAG: hypothetical protein GY915_05560 [bacterium]|nr:hypothetical protein [bacterium]
MKIKPQTLLVTTKTGNHFVFLGHIKLPAVNLDQIAGEMAGSKLLSLGLAEQKYKKLGKEKKERKKRYTNLNVTKMK